MSKRTGRFWAFIAAAFIFYFFANQTQVGWLYVVAALLTGIAFTAYLLNRRALHGVIVERELQRSTEDDLHEGDNLAIKLTINSTRRIPNAHLAVTENCPLADPDSDEYQHTLFVPLLDGAVSFQYAITVHQRGLHTFPDVAAKSRAPFGLFERHGVLRKNTGVLVYPEVRELRHFALLDRRPAAQLTHPRAGLGSEVIGVRPYRPGDSPRHIHWRSVAKRGQLVSKEFAEETQPGMTVVLDRYCPLQPFPAAKHQPFEMAVKCAVSMGKYALDHGYPLYLAADSEDMAVPQGALVWDALMQYTAKVPALQRSTLADVLNYQPLQQFVAVALAWPDETAVEALIALKHRGYQVFVAVPDPASYPIDNDTRAADFVTALQRAEIMVRVIRHGDDWAQILSDDITSVEVNG